MVDLRVQIAWGGNETILWRGEIRCDGGKFSNVRLLGLDADQPGSFVIDDSKIRIEPRFSNRYSGLEVTVSAPANASLDLSLKPDIELKDRSTVTIPLAQLSTESRTIDLGNSHRIRVGRVAGDRLRVRLNRQRMVFSPGERISLDLDPHLLGERSGTQLKARLRLQRPYERRNEFKDFLSQTDVDLWTRTENVRVDENGEVEPITGITIPVPEEEGVYDLLIDLHRRLPLAGTVARRKLQFVVIDSRRPALMSDSRSALVTEFNPAEPRWFERLTQLPQWGILPGSKRGPWFEQTPRVNKIQNRDWTSLAEDGWIAYSLPVRDTNLPHIVDIEFPAGVAQDVGISILDGEHSVASLDSGVAIGDPDLKLPDVSLPTVPTHHRLVFWPRTHSPSVLITNRSPGGDVSFGRIRLEVFNNGLPTDTPAVEGKRRRIASIDGDRLKEIFHANNPWNADTKVSFDDWQTFYEAGTRLVEYLRYAGYDGAKILVAGDGSTIFPSEKLHPTPSFDRGIFADTGQDPYRKDVVEMLMRLFDREGLTFIPAVEFTTPLPELEKQLSLGHELSQGIELEDLHGRLGADFQKHRPGRAPYYNPLDERVQAAMDEVVRAIASRYSHHKSYGGLCVNLSDVGFSQLPDVAWGVDDRTLEAFVRESYLQQPGGRDANRVAELKRLLLLRESTELTRTWFTWRKERLSDLYRRFALSATPEHPLYLSMVDLVDAAPLQRHLRPACPRTTTMIEAMAEIGLDTRILSAIPNVTLIQPHPLAPNSHLHMQAVNLEIMDEDTADIFANSRGSASQFAYESFLERLNQFDTLGPPVAASRNVHESFVGYAGTESRRPYARSLAAHDDVVVFDGGTTLPMGQEAAVKGFFKVFRQLPARPFQLVELENVAPLAVRMATVAGETWVYAVNKSPWSLEVNLQWAMPQGCEVSVLGADDAYIQELLDQTDADMNIKPYGLVAMKFSSDKIELTGCKTRVQQSGVLNHLGVQIEQIVSRREQIQKPTAVELLRDSGFESSLGDPNNTAWKISSPRGGIIGNDYRVAASGNASLHMQFENGPVAATSHDFQAPMTGRMVVSLKVRNPDGGPVPLMLRLLSSDQNYQPVHRFERKFGPEFTNVALRFSDLPLDPKLRLRLQIELIGPGEVWIDDVETYDKWFGQKELQYLERMVQNALFQRKKLLLGECYETLGGYWPRFLLRHVPSVEVAAKPIPAVAPLPEPEKSGRAKLMDRMKKYLRFRLY